MAVGAVTTSNDVDNLIGQLMALEAKPLEQKEEEKANLESEKILWDQVDDKLEDIQYALDNLQKSSSFLARTASSSSSSTVSASSATNAATGTYIISGVVLATAASITSSTGLTLLSGSASTKTSTADIASGAFDPNAAFSSGKASTGLDEEITAGSFTVNGKTITVTESDTIYMILGKINASGAGVEVSITEDAGDQRVVFTQERDGNYHIEFGETDSSNFLDAINATAATESAGNLPDWQKNIADTDLDQASNAMQDGYFTINGLTFAVDIDNDSVQEIISNINSSAAGVTAFLDEELGKITIQSNLSGEDLYFKNDTSNFLTKFNLIDQDGDADGDANESQYQGTDATVRVNGVEMTKESNTFTVNGTTYTLKTTGSATVTVSRNTSEAVGHVKVFVGKYNDAMNFLTEKSEDREGPLFRNNVLRSLKTRLKSMAISSVENPGAYNYLSELGVKFSYGGDHQSELAVDDSKLTAALEADELSVFQFFANDTDSDTRYDDTGFAPVMNDYLEDYTQTALGYIYKRQSTVDDRVDLVDEKITKLENSLAIKEEMLYEQFHHLLTASIEMQKQTAQVQNILKTFG